MKLHLSAEITHGEVEVSGNRVNLPAGVLEMTLEAADLSHIPRPIDPAVVWGGAMAASGGQPIDMAKALADATVGNPAYFQS